MSWLYDLPLQNAVCLLAPPDLTLTTDCSLAEDNEETLVTSEKGKKAQNV